MAAIITEQFRRNTAKFLLENIADNTTNYYIGLGKSDSWVEDEASRNWTVPDPSGTLGEDYEIKSNLITLLKAEASKCSLVIPRVNYKSGAFYKVYNPHDENCFFPETINGIPYLPCYAVNTIGSNVAIFLCLKAPNVPSASVPTDTTTYSPRPYGDGYVWALIDVLSTIDMAVNTDQYVSINSSSVNTSIAPIIENSSGGILYGFTVLNGGSGYIGGLTVTFKPYTATTTVPNIICSTTINSNGEITEVKLPTNYIYATGIVNGTFEFSSAIGSGAVIVPNITPALGLAHTPANVLPSWFIGMAVQAVDNIYSDGFYIPYRQISVLKGISHTQTESGNPLSIGALKYIRLSASNSNLLSVPEGEMITFGNGSRALFDSYAEISMDGGETTEYRVYYHQNTKSGYGKIEVGSTNNTITIAAYANISYSSISNNEYVPNSGNVVFIENRKPIIRAQSQTEEIKIIIQL